MNDDSLEKAMQEIIKTLEETDINQIDKIELMINITRLLSKENYKEDIKTLKLNDKRRK